MGGGVRAVGWPGSMDDDWHGLVRHPGVVQGSAGHVNIEGVERRCRRAGHPHVGAGFRSTHCAEPRGGRRKRVGDHRDQVVHIRDGDSGQLRGGQDTRRIGCVAGGGLGVANQRHHEIQQGVGHVGQGSHTPTPTGSVPNPKLRGNHPGDRPLGGHSAVRGLLGGTVNGRYRGVPAADWGDDRAPC